MGIFNIEDNKGLRLLRMTHGKANTINRDFVSELRKLIHQTEGDDGILGMVLAGQKNFFSAGLDIVELYGYNAAEFETFWEEFMHLVYEMSAFRKPLIAAITGHAPAGGCVMAITADYRIMANGKYKIGLNEVPVGIIVPPSIFHLYSYWIGERLSSQFLLEGKMHTVEEAEAIGLVDKVVEPEQVIPEAMAQLEHYVKFHPEAWRQTKKNCRKALLRNLEVRRDEHFNHALEQWWRPEVREMMQSFIDKLKK